MYQSSSRLFLIFPSDTLLILPSRINRLALFNIYRATIRNIIEYIEVMHVFIWNTVNVHFLLIMDEKESRKIKINKQNAQTYCKLTSKSFKWQINLKPIYSQFVLSAFQKRFSQCSTPLRLKDKFSNWTDICCKTTISLYKKGSPLKTSQKTC